MNLELTDEETAVLARELDAIIRNDRYPLSPRVQALGSVLVKIKPEPSREPLPPPKVYEPPRKGRYSRRG